ncbi:hypothetical protein P7C70_g3879, partial [Phenoliferia sp. Uapishka_3]
MWAETRSKAALSATRRLIRAGPDAVTGTISKALRHFLLFLSTLSTLSLPNPLTSFTFALMSASWSDSDLPNWGSSPVSTTAWEFESPNPDGSRRLRGFNANHLFREFMEDIPSDIMQIGIQCTDKVLLDMHSKLIDIDYDNTLSHEEQERRRGAIRNFYDHVQVSLHTSFSRGLRHRTTPDVSARFQANFNKGCDEQKTMMEDLAERSRPRIVRGLEYMSHEELLRKIMQDPDAAEAANIKRALVHSATASSSSSSLLSLTYTYSPPVTPSRTRKGKRSIAVEHSPFASCPSSALSSVFASSSPAKAAAKPFKVLTPVKRLAKRNAPAKTTPPLKTRSSRNRAVRSSVFPH